MRPSWVIQVGPEYHDKCPYKRNTEANRERGGHAQMKEGIRILQP